MVAWITCMEVYVFLQHNEINRLKNTEEDRSLQVADVFLGSIKIR